jgi:catechol 2,3-dioxygenase-like lactoylglutathione lyase family enzyme
MADAAVPAAQLRLDHVSIEVPDFADAVDRLDEVLGLRVMVSPQAPGRHGRFTSIALTWRSLLTPVARYGLSGPSS